MLKNEADPVTPQFGAAGVGERGDLGVLEPNRAVIGSIQPGDQVQQRALAAAGFARQRDALAGLEVEIDAAQHVDRLARRSEGFGEVSDAQQGQCAGRN